MALNKKILLIPVALLFASSAAHAEGVYGTLLLGANSQINSSEAFGNNIAIDPDFPSEFDFDAGGSAAIGIGYDFNNSFRIEGRIAKRISSFDATEFGTGARDGEEYILNGEFESTSITLEGFYDFENHSSVTPYLKSGIGISKNSYAARLGGAGAAGFDAFDGMVDGYYDNYADGSSTNFTWNIGFGASVEVSEKVSLFGEYQYASFGSIETGADSFTDGFGVDATAHEVFVGIRTNF